MANLDPVDPIDWLNPALKFIMDKLVPIADCKVDPCVKAIAANATGIQSPNRGNSLSYVMSHGGKSPVFQCRKPLGNRKSRALRRGKSNCQAAIYAISFLAIAPKSRHVSVV